MMNQGLDSFTMVLSVTMIMPVWIIFSTILAQWIYTIFQPEYLPLGILKFAFQKKTIWLSSEWPCDHIGHILNSPHLASDSKELLYVQHCGIRNESKISYLVLTVFGRGFNSLLSMSIRDLQLISTRNQLLFCHHTKSGYIFGYVAK
jgi:hypothetical protein